jgi:type I restriction enzyme R subunit
MNHQSLSSFDAKAEQEANNILNASILLRRDMETFGRVYAFLPQIFDYGNTALEKRAIFYKRLIPLLEFGRAREGVDLSKVVLTHHRLKDQGAQHMDLRKGDADKLKPMEPGGGEVHEPQKAYFAEIIARVKAKNNTKEQFANSPDFSGELMNAIMDALSAHESMSKQVLDSERVRAGLKDILLEPAKLYEALRDSPK